jgi:hypothetical protein
MSLNFNFSQLLRPVGQMLEPLSLESFSLTVEDGNVSVRAHKCEEQGALAQDLPLRVSWQMFRRKKPGPVSEPQPSSGRLEVHYTREDIERADTEGQARRKTSGATPEAHALSQVLRAVGGYVDQKGGWLVAVTKVNQDITIEYDSALRKKMTEQFTVASLYDYWVKMYMRRKHRA